MGSCHRLPMILGLACLPVAAIAAPLILTRSDFAPPASLPISLLDQLPPAERLASCRRQLVRTERELAQTQRDLRDIQDRLSTAEAYRMELPVLISQLSLDVEDLEKETSQLERELDAAALEASQIQAAAPAELEAEERQAAADRTVEIANAAEKIDEARRQRDNERKRLGALPSTQDEAIHTSQQKRRATAQADLRFENRVDTTRKRLEQSIATSLERTDQIKETLQRKQSELRDSKRLLSTYKVKLEQLPPLISELKQQATATESRLGELMDAKELHEQAVALALIEVKDEQEQVAARKSALAAPPPTALSNSAKHSPKTYAIPAAQQRRSDSRYYDMSYRPDVGYHRVEGYVRRNGTHVQSHMRTNRDDSFANNWSSAGNTNPFTGKPGTRRPRFR